MPGDPHQCRVHSARCLPLAQAARNPETRQNFAGMAETWTKLAAEIESDQALLSALHELELGDPCYTLPEALKLPSAARLHNGARSEQCLIDAA
jgi:hypothetical protein